MEDFKLIAIRPLVGCSEKYTKKILIPGEFYVFYNDYKFEAPDKNDQDVVKISYEPSISNDLYTIGEGKTKINISAVVGKNGSGKSTLMELFFVAIYNLCIETELLKSDLNELKNQIELKGEIEEATYGDIIDSKINDAFITLNTDKGNLEIIVDSGTIKLNAFEKKLEINTNILESKLNTYLPKKKLQVEEDIKVELYYSIGGKIYCLKSNSSKESYNLGYKTVSLYPRREADLLPNSKISNETNTFTFKFDKVNEIDKKDIYTQFLYTIAVNYSAYGLNSRQIGTWIDSLFHKNDGYQTPIVINPWREDGNMDINIENDLVKQRLLSNILEPIDTKRVKYNLRNIASGKIAQLLVLKYDYNKATEEQIRWDRISYEKLDNKCLRILYQKYTGRDLMGSEPSKPYYRDTKLYINHKLVKICQRYLPYKDFFQKKRFQDVDTFVQRIYADNSHITFKIKQALNFLRYKHITIPDNYNDEFTVDINNLSINIREIREKQDIRKEHRKLSTIELIPPSFFYPKILLHNNGSFDNLSSGEKQKIYCISSVVYHLMNLNSVFNNKTKPAKSLIKYKYVNLMFDEVELYFHPDFQREFVHDLLDYIKKINTKNIKHIEGLNILFSTHSPFILSDIPVNNILLLKVKDGKAVPQKWDPKNQTFGANVHDLLANEFFMENGFMGEWAKSKIIDTIKFLNHELIDKKIKEIGTKDNLTTEKKVEIKKLIKQLKEYKSKLKKDEAFQIIELIGEPVLKNKLKDMRNEAFAND